MDLDNFCSSVNTSHVPAPKSNPTVPLVLSLLIRGNRRSSSSHGDLFSLLTGGPMLLLLEGLGGSSGGDDVEAGTELLEESEEPAIVPDWEFDTIVLTATEF